MPRCPKHPNVEMVMFCPVCRGSSGGKLAAKGMTKAERTARASKAAKASHAKNR